MVDLSRIKIFTVSSDGGLIELKISPNLQLLPEQTYLIVNEETRRIYLYKGIMTPVQLKFIGARSAKQLQMEYGLTFKVSSIDQGEETTEFLEVINQAQVILPGEQGGRNDSRTDQPQVYTSHSASSSPPHEQIGSIAIQKDKMATTDTRITHPKTETQPNLNTYTHSPSYPQTATSSQNIPQRAPQAVKKEAQPTTAVPPKTGLEAEDISKHEISREVQPSYSQTPVKEIPKPMSLLKKKKKVVTAALSPDEMKHLLITIDIPHLHYYPEYCLYDAFKNWHTYYRELNVPQAITRIVAQNFEEGSPIEGDKIQPFKISHFLVPLEENENAFREITKTALQEAVNHRTYRFVVGDFGAGKSQLKFRIYHEIFNMQENILPITVDVGLGLGHLKRKLLHSIKKFFFHRQNPLLAEIEPLLERIERTRSENFSDFSNDFLEILEVLTENDIVVVLLLDEIAKIEEATQFIPWLDLITSIHDHIRQGLLTVFFIKERDIERLFLQDPRMERLSKWLYQTHQLRATYGDNLFDALANILALRTVSLGIELGELGSRFLEHIFTPMINERTATIRKINVSCSKYARTLEHFVRNRQWLAIAEKLNEYSQTQQLNFIITTIQRILEETDIFFDYQDIAYRAKFTKLREPSKDDIFHVGKYTLFQEEHPTLTLGDVSLYLFSSDTPQIDEIKRKYQTYLSKEENAVFLGLTTQSLTENTMKSFGQPGNLKTIKFVNKHLLYLLLAYNLHPTNLNEKETNRHIKSWFTHVINLRNDFLPKLESLAELHRKRTMESEIHELKSMIQEIQKQQHQKIQPPSKSTPTEKITKQKTPAPLTEEPTADIKNDAIFVTISAFEIVKSRKQRDTTINSLAKDLQNNLKGKNISIDLATAEDTIQSVLSWLVEHGFLKATQKFYIKTQKWNKTQILSMYQ